MSILWVGSASMDFSKSQMPEKSFQVTSRRRVNGKTFLAWMTMMRQGKHHTVRSDLTGLTLLIITTKQSVTFYGKMYGKVQYHTPIPSHVPVKVNTVTCAGKGFVTPNIHDELPHSFFSATENSNYLQWSLPWVLNHYWEFWWNTCYNLTSFLT